MESQSRCDREDAAEGTITTRVLRLARPGRGWSESWIDDERDADQILAGADTRERAEGTRMEVELVWSDGRRVLTSSRVAIGGRWVDLLGLPPPAAWALKGARAS